MASLTMINLRKIKQKQKTYKQETELEQIFNLNKDQILVAGDNNTGYVCIDTTDLLQQYEDINKKQHLNKINIREEWYLKNINRYLKEASEHIPTELTEIIKKIRFYLDRKNSRNRDLKINAKYSKTYNNQ